MTSAALLITLDKDKHVTLGGGEHMEFVRVFDKLVATLGSPVQWMVGLILDNPSPVQIQSKSSPRFVIWSALASSSLAAGNMGKGS